MKTVDIKGKAYVMVNERIAYFRSEPMFDGWSLTSEVVDLNDKRVVIKAIITDNQGVVRANGIAYENQSSSFINKTSYIENCETSAWGRALANMGIGIDASMASADEVANAIKQQSSYQEPAPTAPFSYKDKLQRADIIAKIEILAEEQGKTMAITDWLMKKYNTDLEHATDEVINKVFKQLGGNK